MGKAKVKDVLCFNCPIFFKYINTRKDKERLKSHDKVTHDPELETVINKQTNNWTTNETGKGTIDESTVINAKFLNLITVPSMLVLKKYRYSIKG